MRRIALAALATALAACATSGPEVPALVEVETVHGSGIHRVTVGQDGSVVRRSHRFVADTSRTGREQTLTSDQLRAIVEVLATPVNAEQESVPLEASEFRITARGSPSWSVECHEIEVHRCPIPFLKLWQSLDEIIGDLPERHRP